MVEKFAEQLVTKKQLELLYTAWGTCAEVPKKGKKSLVVWPWKEHAEITFTPHTSDYGDRLYKIEFFRH